MVHFVADDASPDGVVFGVPALPSLTDLSHAGLLSAVREIEQAGRRIDRLRVLAAAEIAARSSRALGYDGLAAREGHRTPEKLLVHLTGVSHAEAARRVRVGGALHPAVDEPASVVGSLVGSAVTDGVLGIEQADAIVRQLGSLDTPTGPAVDPDALTSVVSRLIDSGAPADVLTKSARGVQRVLETAITPLQREESLRARAYLRFGKETDGMLPMFGLLDPESAATARAFFNAVTSPRRGGPRPVNPIDQARVEELLADDRTDDQLRADAFIEALRITAGVGSTRVLGSARPAVRVVVTAEQFLNPDGIAHLDGHAEPISSATASRIACDTGLLRVALSTHSEVLDVGRTLRLHTPAMRAALAAQQGGCLWPECDRPPSWCEAHHIVHYDHGGATSTQNGALLCRHHHMLLHNNNWTITHTDGNYTLTPPPDIDPTRTPRPMPLTGITTKH